MMLARGCCGKLTVLTKKGNVKFFMKFPPELRDESLPSPLRCTFSGVREEARLML